MRCDGQFVAGIREAAPTADGWANFERTGHISFACSHGLTVSGPDEQVKPLVELHQNPKPDEQEIADFVRDPRNHAAVSAVFQVAGRHREQWLVDFLRREARIQGTDSPFLMGR